MKEIKVMHFQYTNWARMRSKHRWYQCFELITSPRKSALDIFRMYHHMYAVLPSQITSIPPEWIQGYKQFEIDIEFVDNKSQFWWDLKILDYFEQYGNSFFRQIYIWDIKWNKIAKINGKKTNPYEDPRLLIDRLIQFWLIKTQPFYPSRNIKRIDKIIKKIFHY